MQRMSSKWGMVSLIVVLVIGALSVLAYPGEAQLPKSGTAKVHSGWFSAGETKRSAKSVSTGLECIGE